jgi:hypothetical protein
MPGERFALQREQAPSPQKPIYAARQSGNDLPEHDAYNAGLSFPLFGTSEPA